MRPVGLVLRVATLGLICAAAVAAAGCDDSAGGGASTESGGGSATLVNATVVDATASPPIADPTSARPTPPPPVVRQTTWVVPRRQAAEPGGDGDGWASGDAALADDGVEAFDQDSGAGLAASCLSAAKDRYHS